MLSVRQEQGIPKIKMLNDDITSGNHESAIRR